MATIAQIKKQLGYQPEDKIDFTAGEIEENGTKKKTGWLRNWDDNTRTAIVMHQDVLKAIQEGATNLAVKSEANKIPQKDDKNGERLPYTQYTIITATSIVASI